MWQSDAGGNYSHYSHRTFGSLSNDVNEQRDFFYLEVISENMKLHLEIQYQIANEQNFYMITQY